MERKKFKLGLVPKLIIAIILGILIGQFLPESVCRLVVTLSGIFSTFLTAFCRDFVDVKDNIFAHIGKNTKNYIDARLYFCR